MCGAHISQLLGEQILHSNRARPPFQSLLDIITLCSPCIIVIYPCQLTILVIFICTSCQGLVPFEMFTARCASDPGQKGSKASRRVYQHTDAVSPFIYSHWLTDKMMASPLVSKKPGSESSSKQICLFWSRQFQARNASHDCQSPLLYLI